MSKLVNLEPLPPLYSYLETKLVAVVGDEGTALGVLARHPPLEAAVESTPSVSFMVRLAGPH